uniref:3-hydroxyacyl-[acyl-carrier-protein] dehydratase FabZ n=1 Tax=Candidatus Kentrum sp. SD TaxID=2126332 RepID=A0A451BHK3_9GAMM|nr:MAG: 3-hydroxyacyl-[acyl-carrier-protein] dehydratase [Candidatus Kentron sp. SD]VFK45609.1 MAG: 3-hydroxyacyl-[acyl-carrier-protein] dehydratase [Candidatus Kentron sp. SD]VFK77749.1 MAG: 3-hydroxyacyl-[acyl-carrier-protein] dehydratase [Candidatus Kentron sp. SD]
MDIREILEYLPHRYPFLLIDRVLEYTPGKSLVALKNVTSNEPFFQGHFPDRPLMPAVLILEAMAQAAGLITLRDMKARLPKNSEFYFVGIDKARFRKPVGPGDQLIFNAELLRTTRGIWKFDVMAKVEEQPVASAELMGAFRGIET